jgi:Zn-finger nucleic acid-binding protein
MRCVKCEGKLITVRIDDVDVDQCERCAGIWFDAHELERILRRPHIEPLLGRAKHAIAGHPERGDVDTPPDDDRRGHCPRCKGEGCLVRIAGPKASIHIDTCALCGGKWLDGGEIDLLKRNTLGDRLRRLLDWVLDLG